MKKVSIFILVAVTILSCTITPSGGPPTASSATSSPSISISPTESSTPIPPTETSMPTPTPTPAPPETLTAIPTVESLKAKVTTDLLSCRYGPGTEYLYLYALKAGANIKLIGRTDANNWVWVDGKNKCWVNAKFLEIKGNKLSLPVVYPGVAKLPI